ncbi:MAG: carboxymuconolactone decarboxylase family protein [candidate division NC10 bacterium]|nr:carboxymuconolactone decarboxylase family protein [candidate division NC10 bacterium]
MAWVATGPDNGRFDHILACHGLNPAAQRAHIGLYRAIMFGESPLSRVEREMLAVCVSAVNNCHY